MFTRHLEKKIRHNNRRKNGIDRCPYGVTQLVLKLQN